jgi:hypothetical protein
LRKSSLILPDFKKVTATERAARVCERDIVFKDGRTETLKIYRAEPEGAFLTIKAFESDDVYAQLEMFSARFLRVDMAFVKTISGFSVGQIFMVGWALASAQLFNSSAKVIKSIMADIICQNERNRPDDPAQN